MERLQQLFSWPADNAFFQLTILFFVAGEFLSEGGDEPVERVPNDDELVVTVEPKSRRGRVHNAETMQVPGVLPAVVNPVKIARLRRCRQFARCYDQHLRGMQTIDWEIEFLLRILKVPEIHEILRILKLSV